MMDRHRATTNPGNAAALAATNAVPAPAAEDPILIEGYINQMDRVLSLMHPQETAAYKLACEESPHLATSRSLRLQFLRAEGFLPGQAAHRLTQYFATIQALFGADLLGKEIRLSHLDTDDMNALRSGGIQHLTQKDISGCPILFINEDSCRYLAPENVIRVALYILDVMSRDIRAQKSGVIRIRYEVAANTTTSSPADGLNFSLFVELEKFFRFAAPIRIERHHLIQDSSLTHRPTVALFRKVLSEEAQQQFFYHTVSRHQSSAVVDPFVPPLETFGIPISCLPLHANNQVRSDYHLQWLGNRQVTEHTDLEDVDQSIMYPRFTNPSASAAGGMATNNILQDPQPAMSANTQPQSHYHDIMREQEHQQLQHNHQPNTLPTIENLPAPLALDSDSETLSEYQCLLRHQIEVFVADETDIEPITVKQARVIELGQVGLRCRHCVNATDKAPGSVYFPGSLGMLYQAAQNLAKNHICTGCRSIPENTQAGLNRLRADKRRAASGKQYWKNTAVSVFGIYQHGKGLWIKRRPQR